MTETIMWYLAIAIVSYITYKIGRNNERIRIERRMNELDRKMATCCKYQNKIDYPTFCCKCNQPKRTIPNSYYCQQCQEERNKQQ